MTSASCVADSDSLIDIWRAAQLALGRLPEREQDCANLAAVLPLPAAMLDQSNVVLQSRAVQQAHSLVPVGFGLVEFDAMMTTRQTLNEGKLSAVRSSVTAYPDDTELANICLSLSPPPARVSMNRWDGQRLLIVTDSDDFRLLSCDASLANSSHSLITPGIAQASLQWVMGTSLPVMHVVRMDGRVLLVKGHHRAQVLRALGVKHLPCLISSCESIDDVLAAAPTLSRRAVELCFSQRRPPMARDFDRSAFVHQHEVAARQLLVQVKVDFTSNWLPLAPT